MVATDSAGLPASLASIAGPRSGLDAAAGRLLGLDPLDCMGDLMATSRLEPIEERPSLSDQVYLALREALLSGTLAPGDQLREGEIAQELGVSKTPVREALSVLRAKGLVKSSPTRGIVVIQVDVNAVKQLYEVRALLEPDAVRRALPMADKELVARASRLLDKARDYGQQQDFNALSQSNRDFHELLYERCQNLEMQRILNDMRDQFRFVAANGWRGASPSWELERTEHLAILDAVARGDANGVAELSRDHLERASIRLFGSDHS